LVELTTTNVDGHYMCRTVLQQAISEASRRGPNVEAVLMRDVDTKVLQSTLKLDSSAPDKPISHRRNMNCVAWRNQRCSIAHHCPVHPHAVVGKCCLHLGCARQQPAVEHLTHQ
jgi:hypothetical protein